jgi:hypoxanthine phosphoribosyltransferase
MKTEKNITIGSYKFTQYCSRADILDRTFDLARQITNDYRNSEQEPVLLLLMTGGIYLGVDLSRALDELGCLHVVDSIGLRRYTKDEVGGAVGITSLSRTDLSGRDVIVVDDIVDHGDTMNFLHNYWQVAEQKPKSVKYCTMFLKSNHKPLDFELDYLGWPVGPEWLVGNGMDSEGLGRGLEDIYIRVK